MHYLYRKNRDYRPSGIANQGLLGRADFGLREAERNAAMDAAKYRAGQANKENKKLLLLGDTL